MEEKEAFVAQPPTTLIGSEEENDALVAQPEQPPLFGTWSGKHYLKNYDQIDESTLKKV